MAEGLGLDTIVQLFGSLGTGALFVYLYFKERGESQKKIDQKDGDLKELNSKVMDVIKGNTQISSELKSSIEANTDATRTLAERVTDVLLERRRVK
jgi:hypothetical protein